MSQSAPERQEIAGGICWGNPRDPGQGIILLLVAGWAEGSWRWRRVRAAPYMRAKISWSPPRHGYSPPLPPWPCRVSRSRLSQHAGLFLHRMMPAESPGFRFTLSRASSVRWSLVVVLIVAAPCALGNKNVEGKRYRLCV